MNIEISKQTRLLTANKVCRENIDIIPRLQSKTATGAGTVLPDAGYLGLSKVVVSTPEVSASVLDNLDNPLLPKFGRLKYFESSRSAVRYQECYPTATSNLESGVHTASGSAHGTSMEELVGLLYANGNKPVGMDAEMKRLIIGGTAYDAYFYATDLAVMWSKLFIGGIARVSDKYVPPCICKIAVYNESTGEIEIQEYSVSGTELPEVTTPAVSGSISGAMSALDITVGFPLSLVIIGAEFVYQKYDVVFSGSVAGVQYSVNDGVTFADVTDGLTIRQAEHIVFKNGSAGTVKIGSTAGGSDYASLPVGATKAAAVLAGGKWYVS